MTELAHADASEEEILSAATGQASSQEPPEASEAPAREARD
jgi:hypothetical protein